MSSTLDCSAGSGWDCARGLTLGLLSGLTWLGLVFCTLRVFSVVRGGNRQHVANLVILLLALAQTFLMTLQHLVVRDERIVYFVDYFRVMQNSIVCGIYAGLACHTLGKPKLWHRFCRPFFIVVRLYLTLILVATLIAMGGDAACFHPSWLLMSTSDFLLCVLFMGASCVVLRDVRSAGDVKVVLSSFVKREQTSLEQTKRSTCVLLTVTFISATFELALDVYLNSLPAFHEAGGGNSTQGAASCLILSTNDDPGTQILRILLSLIM